MSGLVYRACSMCQRAKFWRLTGCTEIGLQWPIFKLRLQGFRICMMRGGLLSQILSRNIFLSNKIALKRPFLGGHRLRVTSLWRVLEAKPVTSGWFLGYPWNFWDIALHSSYVEGWWHQKWLHSSGRYFFWGNTENAKKKRHIESHIFRILTNAVEWWDDTAVKIGIEIKNLTIEMEIINWTIKQLNDCRWSNYLLLHRTLRDRLPYDNIVKCSTTAILDN